MTPASGVTLRTAAILVRLPLLIAIPFAAREQDPGAVLLLTLALLATLPARLAPPGSELAFSAGLAALIGVSALGLLPDQVGGDLVMHLVGSGLLALALIRGAVTRVGALRRWQAPVTVASVVLVGVAWEVAELISDAHYGSHMSLGALDTGTDLLADLAGALTTVVLTTRASATTGAGR